MNKQELRIGNIIHYNGTPQTVKELRKDGIISCSLDGRVCQFSEYNNIEGFSITEQLLIKAGFEKSTTKDGDEIMQMPNTNFYIEYFGFADSESMGWYWSSESLKGGDKRYNFIHQLQNLYFVLTGEELKIEL